MGCSKGKQQLSDVILNNTKHTQIICWSFWKPAHLFPLFFTLFFSLAGFTLTDHVAPLTCFASQLVTAHSLKWELRCHFQI